MYLIQKKCLTITRLKPISGVVNFKAQIVLASKHGTRVQNQNGNFDTT